MVAEGLRMQIVSGALVDPGKYGGLAAAHAVLARTGWLRHLTTCALPRRRLAVRALGVGAGIPVAAAGQ